MNNVNFIHLRVHSAYTLSNGAILIKDLLDLCHKFKMPAVAVTDINNLFGALEFSQLAKELGIQPIIGCQLQVNFSEADDVAGQNGIDPIQKINPCPMIVLVRNEIGYKNLLQILAYDYQVCSNLTFL